MQILPLIQRSSQSAASDAATIGSAGLGSRQSALFASILDSARTTTAASTADQPKASTYSTTNEDTSHLDVVEACLTDLAEEEAAMGDLQVARDALQRVFQTA